MSTEKTCFKTNLGPGLLLMVVLLCTACGAKVIKGEPPLVRMTELSHRNNNINLQLSMRNINGVDLDVRTINFNLTANEEDKELVAYSGPVEIKIVANGIETWSVEVVESASSRDLLNALESGEIKSLPYTLKGSVASAEAGTLRFEYEGHIYPLPGKPGFFR